MIPYTNKQAVELSVDFLNTILGDLPNNDKDRLAQIVFQQIIVRMFDEWYLNDVIRNMYTFGEYLVKGGF